MPRDKTEELQTERDHSRFLEELLRALCGDGWDQLTIYEAKKKKAEIAVLKERCRELENWASAHGLMILDRNEAAIKEGGVR